MKKIKTQNSNQTLKFETTESYLARGGQIEVLPTRKSGRRVVRGKVLYLSDFKSKAVAKMNEGEKVA
jgi:hypothetical protein